MADLYAILDGLMCVLWMLTYVFALIGTVKYRYPVISPASQIFFVTNEFAVLLYFLTNASAFYGYVLAAYFLWALLEIAIFAAILKVGFLKRRRILPYLLCVAAGTVLLYYLIVQKGLMLYICYANVFFGVLLWLRFICRREYPMKPLALAAFVAKFFADAVVVPYYMMEGSKLIGLISLVVPMLDLLFIPVYFKRKNRKEFT